MLGYLAGAFAYGFLKSAVVGVKASGSFPVLHGAAGVLEEELTYRVGLERGLGKVLGLKTSTARFGQAALFGFVDHPHNPLDAMAGGVLYSYAYEKGGLPLAVGCHLAHNLAVHLGGL